MRRLEVNGDDYSVIAKASIHLLTATLFENNNQFNNFGAWVITGITFVTAVGQIYWINMGLQRYDAYTPDPSLLRGVDVIRRYWRRDLFRRVPWLQCKAVCLVYLSITVIFVGVIVLAGRLLNRSAMKRLS
ncbi:hypothetical protein BASA61_010025 [Batrachochytrium salamandrivorans]|nr:hypothetical protein BASA61_010025 [Batrachochytrium salamandrivorans]